MPKNQKSHQDVYDPLNDKVTNFKTKSCTQKDLLSSRERNNQKQPSNGVLRKSCTKTMHQIYLRTPMPKCNFNKIAKQLY